MAALILLLIAACKKDKEEAKLLAGTWELRQTQGMIMTDHPPGKGNLLKFSKDRYEIHQEGVLKRSGTFGTNAKGTATGVCDMDQYSQTGNIIIFSDNPYEEKQYYQVSGNQLKTSFGCQARDGWITRQYEKIVD